MKKEIKKNKNKNKNKNKKYEKTDYSRPNENRKAKVTAARAEFMDNWEEEIELEEDEE